MKTFKNKVAIVTGGGGTGIGHELVKAFASRGAHVAFCDIANLENTEKAISGYDVKSYSENVDMADKEAIRKFITNVKNELGYVDILINNAGIALGDITFDKVKEEDMEKITDINYWGVIYTTMFLYEHLKNRPEAAIVNLSSSQGILSLPNLVPYCTTKFAVRGFTDTLRMEHKIYGIDNVSVHTVHPGRVATNITLNADYHGKNTKTFHDDLQRGTKADKAAEIILNGIRNKTERIFISDGRSHDVLARLLPAASHKVVSLMMKMKKFDTTG